MSARDGRDENQAEIISSASVAAAAEADEEAQLDLMPGPLEKIDDPTVQYFHEMGTVPLLTRNEEVAMAQRIERGQRLAERGCLQGCGLNQ